MKYPSIFIVFVFIHCNLKSQNSSDHFKTDINIIEIEKLDSLSSLLWPYLTPYKLIMIGEMHGTNEPAAFVTGLAQLFAFHGDSVQVGFEIPSDQMGEFLKVKTEKSIYNSEFFSKISNDGRASKAWATAIATLNKNPRINIFFYDIISGESRFIDDRDSIMYLKIKSNIKAHLKWKTITLSGNIHNMLQPYKGEKKAATFLRNDSELKLKNKLCALNHNYESGTMLNNVGKGLELRQVNMGESSYSKRSHFDNFLFLHTYDPANTYSGFFFTKTVTAATLTGTRGTFTVSGTITNLIKKVPVDTSVFVKLITETGGLYKTYCNQEGKYAFTLSDSLNGKRIILTPNQDEHKIKKDSITGACSYSCTTSDVYLASTESAKLKINTDSTRNYIADFGVITPNVHFFFPSLYFKKNELQLVQSDRSLSTDSAICGIINIIQCNKQIRIEINGNSSPHEKNKKMLSLKRAVLIRDQLIALGVNPARITTRGNGDSHFGSTKEYYKAYGDPRPAYINKTDYEGQRVTFYVTGMDFKE
jgi:hypothetical protein